MTTVTFAGTIAPYIFEHSQWSQGLLVDAAGVFGTRGEVLTGDAFNVTWTFNGGTLFSGVLTINGHTLGYSGGSFTFHNSPLYVNTTVVPGLEAMNTYEPAANPSAPFGIGGGFRHQGLNGYFMVSSADLNGAPVFNSVPVPIAGAGLPGLLIIGAFLLRALYQRRMSNA